MPLGGSTISWDAQPVGAESVGLGDDRIRSMKTSVQQALANEHNFPSTGGASTGYHLLGSARAFYGTQSVVSSSDTDGRMMITSNTSRLFGVGSSGGTMLLGGELVISHGSGVSAGGRFYWAIESESTPVSSATTTNVTFPRSGFSTSPYVFAQADWDEGPVADITVNVTKIRTSGFSFVVTRNGSTITAFSVLSVMYLALGQRTL